MEPTQQITPEELLGPLNEVERKHAPERLWLAGDVSLFRQGPRVSVVGSRKASREGLNRARRLARALVERGIVVVSGLAEGIDAAAHEAAIEAGGKTIAVLGTPLDRCFPEANRALQDRIMRDHVAVSQLAPGSSVQKASFPARNRTMALLTDATVIVEAGPKSGTQHQGWEALRLGRLLFFLRSVATEKNLPWVQDMVGYGAQVLTDENISQALDHMPERSRGEEIPF
jgi:DNA processing protein